MARPVRGDRLAQEDRQSLSTSRFVPFSSQVELQFSLQLCEENGMAEEDMRAVAAGHEILKGIWRRIMALNPSIVKAGPRAVCIYCFGAWLPWFVAALVRGCFGSWLRCFRGSPMPNRLTPPHPWLTCNPPTARACPADLLPRAVRRRRHRGRALGGVCGEKRCGDSRLPYA